MTAWRVPILGYHWTLCPPLGTASGSRDLYVCPDVFKAELQLLAANGWTFMSYRAFAVAFKAGSHPAAKTAVITIDGTQAEDTLIGSAILAELGIAGTFFVSPGLLGQPGNLTWPDLLNMVGPQGQDVQNHGMLHKTMTNLSGAALAREVEQASHAIEVKLGYRPNTFCYPNGKYDDESRQAVRHTAGMQAAVYTAREPLEDPANPMLMQRIRVPGDYTPADLLARLTPYAGG